MTRHISLALMAILCASCGYSAQFRVPESIKTIAVDLFENRTRYREVEFEFTNALRREVSAKTPLKIAPAEDADAIISGEIIGYRRYLLRETRADRPTEYRIVVTVKYQVKNVKTGAIVAENSRLRRGAEYQLLRGQVERQAREEAIRELARNVVQDAFNRWE